jgi:hypothetical protein
MKEDRGGSNSGEQKSAISNSELHSLVISNRSEAQGGICFCGITAYSTNHLLTDQSQYSEYRSPL